jgi:hypothetical protein
MSTPGSLVGAVCISSRSIVPVLYYFYRPFELLKVSSTLPERATNEDALSLFGHNSDCTEK